MKRINGGIIFGGVVLLLGVIFLIGNLFPRVHIWHFIGDLWPLLLIALGFYIVINQGGFFRFSRSSPEFDNSRLIGDMRLEFGGKEIGDINASHLIGDLSIDLSGARLKPGINHLNASTVIGDTLILVPQNFPVKISARLSIGDLRFDSRREEGFLPKLEYADDSYESADRKLLVSVSGVIGDLTLKKVPV